MIEIEKPVSTDSLDAVRSLMREFVAWHRERHAIDIHLVDSYFDPAAFDAELASAGAVCGAQGALAAGALARSCRRLCGTEAVGRWRLRDEAHVRPPRHAR